MAGHFRSISISSILVIDGGPLRCNSQSFYQFAQSIKLLNSISGSHDVNYAQSYSVTKTMGCGIATAKFAPHPAPALGALLGYGTRARRASGPSGDPSQQGPSYQMGTTHC